jgi:hypothetical protein
VGLNRGQAISVRAVVWLMRKRSNPRVQLEDVEFSWGDYRMKDPDFDPDYWIPEGDDDVLPDDDTIPGGDDTEQDDGDPKDPEARPQDTSPREE